MKIPSIPFYPDEYHGNNFYYGEGFEPPTPDGKTCEFVPIPECEALYVGLTGETSQWVTTSDGTAYQADYDFDSGFTEYHILDDQTAQLANKEYLSERRN